MRKEKEDKRVLDILGEGATYAYLIIMLGIFPMFYRGTLLNISSIKRNFFVTITCLYLCFIIIPFIGEGVHCVKLRRRIRGSVCDVFALVLIIAVLASTVFALDKSEAFWGKKEQKNGHVVVVMLLCMAVYFAIKKYAKYDQILIWVYLIASAFIYLCGILLTCQIDILNMQDGIMSAQKSIFVSPLGNINYNASYISIMLPAGVVMFILCKEVFTRNVLMVYLYLGFMDSICIRSDSILAVLGVMFIVLLYYVLENEKRIMRYGMVVQTFVLANISVYLLKLVLKDHMYDFDGWGAYLLKPQALIAEIVVCCILLWFQVRKRVPAEKKMWKLQKIYGIGLVVVIVLGVVLVLLVNFCFRNEVLGSILEGLLITDETGTGRGYIWIRTIKVFKEMPFVNKLFGCGLNCFYKLMYPFYGTDMMEKFNAVFYEPHNVFLQILIETGIVGVIGYFGMIFSTIRSAAKKRKLQEMQLAVIATLMAFLVQGLVNSDTIFILPLLFIILGLSNLHAKRGEH